MPVTARRVLVLGAGGFLGRSIATHLGANCDAQVVLHHRVAPDVPLDPGCETVMLDLQRADAMAIADLIDRVSPDVVINCVGATVGSPSELRDANVGVVERLIEALCGRGGVHLVQLGSAAEYGIQHRGGPVSEDMFATPGSAYGVTKLEATQRLLEAAAQQQVTATVLRLFNPVGRFSPATSLPGIAAQQIDAALRAGAHAIRLGPLGSWRDYIGTRDVAAAVFAACEHPPRSGALLNVGRGEAIESRSLVVRLAEIAGFDGEIVESEPGSVRSAPVTWQCADVAAITSRYGWSARSSLDESLRELWHEVGAGART